jgi:hypothetical protein
LPGRRDGDQVQGEVMPRGRRARADQSAALARDNEGLSIRSVTSGWRLRNAASEFQCTVASCPSSSPVSAVSMPPEHAEQIVAPWAYMARIQATIRG